MPEEINEMLDAITFGLHVLFDIIKSHHVMKDILKLTS